MLISTKGIFILSVSSDAVYDCFSEYEATRIWECVATCAGTVATFENHWPFVFCTVNDSLLRDFCYIYDHSPVMQQSLATLTYRASIDRKESI